MKVLDHGYVELEMCAGGDAAVVEGARNCYQSEGGDEEKDKRLLHRLLSSKHTSPFEHAVLRFRVKCPLFVRDQIVRHRMASYSIKSLRYCLEDKEYYIPPFVDQVARAVYDDNLRKQHEQYSLLISMGVPPEQARGILGTAYYTEIVWTINCRSLMNFFDQRLERHAQRETREYAWTAFHLWAEAMPVTADAYRRTRCDLFK